MGNNDCFYTEDILNEMNNVTLATEMSICNILMESFFGNEEDDDLVTLDEAGELMVTNGVTRTHDTKTTKTKQIADAIKKAVHRIIELINKLLEKFKHRKDKYSEFLKVVENAKASKNLNEVNKIEVDIAVYDIKSYNINGCCNDFLKLLNEVHSNFTKPTKEFNHDSFMSKFNSICKKYVAKQDNDDISEVNTVTKKFKFSNSFKPMCAQLSPQTQDYKNKVLTACRNTLQKDETSTSLIDENSNINSLHKELNAMSMCINKMTAITNYIESNCSKVISKMKEEIDKVPAKGTVEPTTAEA